MRGAIRTYYKLVKPGIIYGNVLAATGGFLLASKGHIDFWLLAAVLGGTSLVIASACVFNNYVDRSIDKKMTRTKRRAIPAGEVRGRAALSYAAVLGVLGFGVLTTYTNRLVVLFGLVGIFFYVVVYGQVKRHSVHGTLAGTIPGATPPIAGYCAVTGNIDTAAILLFLGLVFWQMPHFYAIAMFRKDDYAAAGIPVLPIKNGSRETKVQILFYTAAYTAAAAALTVSGYTGATFLVVVAGFGLYWLRLEVNGWGVSDDVKWARKMFRFSLVNLLVLCFMLSLNAWLP